MRKLYTIFIILFFTAKLFAQNNIITIPLNQLGRDERFDKFMLTMPVFICERDTVLTLDFENLKPAKKVRIKKPEGYNSYGYSYTFFTGNKNTLNPGYTNLLIAGIYNPKPHLYIDRNNNFDFTDDGNFVILPISKNDSLIFKVNRNDDTLAGISIKLKRLDINSQPAYKKLMNDYYAFFYKDRIFAGVDFSYREQRYITKYGMVKLNGDSFKVALYDGNCDGLYNEVDSDRVLTTNFADSIFDSRDELRSFTITKKTMYIEFHGEQFEIIEIDPAGNFIKLKQLTESLLLGKTKPGEKIPKFTFTTWNGKEKKIRKYKRYDVLLYFTGPNVKNFSKDTIILRKIAEAYPDKLKVIAFIDVNKSYELKIFGTYSNLNYEAAFKEKDIVQKLAIRGLPSSIWLAKKRKVKAYNIIPEDFLKMYETTIQK
jgi:hypothetical protein